MESNLGLPHAWLAPNQIGKYSNYAAGKFWQVTTITLFFLTVCYSHVLYFFNRITDSTVGALRTR